LRASLSQPHYHERSHEFDEQLIFPQVDSNQGLAAFVRYGQSLPNDVLSVKDCGRGEYPQL
jgi:hypothetical protein